MAGRKRKKTAGCSYIMSIDPSNMSRSGAAFRGLLKSNLLGTHFKIMGRVEPRHGGKIRRITRRRRRGEVAAIRYNKNVLGFNGPRYMTVILPQLGEDGKRMELYPVEEGDGLIQRHNTGNLSGLLELQNKHPMWSKETETYVLNFHGRVTRVNTKFSKF